MPSAGARFGPSRYETEARESTDPAHLDVLASRKSSFVQSAVAANVHTSPDTLDRIADTDNQWARKAVAKNPNTTPATLRKLATDAESSVRANVAYNRAAPVEVLTALADDLVADVRAGVGWNRATPSEVLDRLVGDNDPHVRARVAKNSSAPDAALLRLVNDPAPQVRQSLLARNFNPDAPTRTVARRRFNGRRSEVVVQTRPEEVGGRYSADLIWEFARSSDAKVQFRAAAQPDAPEGALLHLVTTTSVDYVLKIVAENRGASAVVLSAVVDRDEVESLKAVAVHPNTDEGTLVRLATSSRPSVREALACHRPGAADWLATHENPKVRIVAAKYLLDTVDLLVAGDLEALGESLLHDCDSAIQVAAASHLPLGLLYGHLAHANPQVRKVIAERALAPEVLESMAGDAKAVVRRAVARNAATPTSALATLASDEDARVRQHAAERFLAALST